MTAALPRIAVLATGGTIAYRLAGVPGLIALATISAEQIAAIGSQDITDTVWFDLARRIEALAAAGDAAGIVITHGTDTMEETAFFLDCVLRTEIPVVLVGSMRPSTAVSADGPANLLQAVSVAGSPQARGRGVLVVLNDVIHGARAVEKTNTTSVQTFHSPNRGPAGMVDAASVRFLSPPAQRGAAQALPDAPPLPRVEIVYAHAGMGTGLVTAAVEAGARGLVLAGVGHGNASTAALGALADAATRGVVVIRASRTGSGFVSRNVEVDDDAHGFVASLDLNPQKARVLAQLLIANGVTDPARVQAAFEERS